MISTIPIGSTNGKRKSVRDVAALYLSRGWVPIPLKERSKVPIPKEWELITLDGYDLNTIFRGGRTLNVGISLGEPSGGLVDCDLDCEESRKAAAMLMPPTDMVWGRQSAPDSHLGFVVVNPPPKATHPWSDPLCRGRGARLLELRSTGGQTVVPPSMLPGDSTGKVEELCIWRSDGNPARIDLEELRRAMNRVAAAALIGRYWPEGNRHDASLALAGGLLRADWSVDDVVALVQAICAAAGDDEVLDRERGVRDTATSLEAGAKTTGWPALAKLLGDRGDTIVTTVRGWLDLLTPTPADADPELDATYRTDLRPDTEHPITLIAEPAVGKPGKFLVVAAKGVSVVHRDTIDLNSAISRKRFTAETMQIARKGLIPDEQSEIVRAYLERELLAIANHPPKPAEPITATPNDSDIEDPRVGEFAKTPGDVRAEAEEMLCDPSLLNRISTDIDAMGVVGENKNRMTLYLVGVSAQLLRPLAVITRGASSSGKSFVAEKVSRLFPPEVVLHATSLTTNALYYFPPGTLRHRWVIVGERSRVQDDDTAEATRALREMIEAGRLSKAVTMKEGDRFVTRRLEQCGPIAYSETTTLSNIFGEDANRCLLLNTDETEDQTRRILGATAAAAAGEGREDVERVCSLHHALQRMIPRVEVVIPYANAIASHYPTARIESRRDFRHLLQLVKAIALLHFRQRERDSSGAVIATKYDYEVAEKLAQAPLGASASGITQGARDMLGKLHEIYETDEFSTSQVKQLGGASSRTLENRLHELDAAGAVEQTTPAKGRVPARWKLTAVNMC